MVRPARPVPAVSSVATTSAKVAWENTAQSDRYAVFWTEDMTATLDALETGIAEAGDARSLPASFSSWNRVILNGLASTPQPEYVITGLTPGTRYKAAVVAAPSGGLSSKPSEEALFATLRDSSLEGVSVAPRRSMADAGQSVELAATPQFKDDASEAVSYEWQRLAEVSDGNGVWETIPDADQSVYRVDVTEATYGARFRCVASAGGGDTGVAPVSFASNNAVVWEDRAARRPRRFERPGDERYPGGAFLDGRHPADDVHRGDQRGGHGRVEELRGGQRNDVVGFGACGRVRVRVARDRARRQQPLLGCR